MTIKEVREIALHAVKGTAPANYTTDSVNQAFVAGLSELAGSVNQFMKNRYDIYDIIVEAIDSEMPKKVIDAISIFAEVQTVPQGQKAIFKKKMGKNRAKKFLTQVGLSGVYETFRLDNETFELAAHAVGGGATIDFERMLDGAESLQEVMQIVTEGLTDAVFIEVQKALVAAINASERPSANLVSLNKFDADRMVKLMSVVRAYGNGVVIFAPPEFVADMGADQIVPVAKAGNQGLYDPRDIAAIHDTGYINILRGAPIIQIPQSFTDETNTTTWINPQFAYILPTGGEKVVKVVLEGATQIRDFQNRDNSMEVYAWKKMGVGILAHHNWAIYQNTGITDTSENPYGY